MLLMIYLYVMFGYEIRYQYYAADGFGGIECATPS